MGGIKVMQEMRRGVSIVILEEHLESINTTWVEFRGVKSMSEAALTGLR